MGGGVDGGGGGWGMGVGEDYQVNIFFYFSRKTYASVRLFL